MKKNMDRSLFNCRNLVIITTINACLYCVTHAGVFHYLLDRPDCYSAPDVCPNEHIRYYLYTTSEPDTFTELSVSNPETIATANFVRGPIKFLIHGYKGHKDYSPNKEIRPEYLRRPQDVNVISIDYGPLAERGCYAHAVDNTAVVAKCTAQFLEHLLDIRPDVIHLSQIRIVALSLGAHVAGQIYEYLTVGQIEHITALDAALPLFAFAPASKRVNRGDAKFIDALHTNAGIKGKLFPYADVDFYANNGTFQPHCKKKDTHSCHIFAAELFAETINQSPNGFPGMRCSYIGYFLGYCPEKDKPRELFGEYVNTEARGTYFFKTRDRPPFALPRQEDD